MKICFLAGADSIHSKRWIEYFIKEGNEIHWISLTPNSFGELKNIKFYLFKNFKLKSLNILFNALSVRRLIKKIKPDVLHVHYAGVNGTLGALSGFHPFVLTAWGSDILIAPKSKIARPIIKFILRKSDLITTDGYNVKKAMIRLGVVSKKIKIIRTGVDIQKFCPNVKDKKLQKKIKTIDYYTIISLRNFWSVYNVDSLIRAIPIILKEVSEVKFILAGAGPEKERLENLTRNLKISKSVEFVGWISQKELLLYLKIADIYVSSSLSDGGLAASTAEAMACELPVVITDSGDNKEWVEDGKNGFIVPIKNPKILAEKIIYLLKNKDKSKSLEKLIEKLLKKNIIITRKWKKWKKFIKR